MELNGVEIHITRKAMRSIRMVIKSPDAKVCVSAPFFVSDREIQAFIRERWDWILQNRSKVLEQSAQLPPAHSFVTGEKHCLFGEEYELQVLESPAGPAIHLRYDKIILVVKPGTPAERRAKIMAEWYRVRLQNELYTLMNKWMCLLNEPEVTWAIRQMKARWGSCCPQKRSMLFNLELARMPLPCVEYVVVHEFTHLQERYHNDHFKALMTVHLPQWRTLKKELNTFAQTHR